MENLDIFMRLGVSLGIGLLTGIERGWDLRAGGPERDASGIRSYALAGLMGGVSGVLGQSLGPTAGVVLVSAVFLAFAAVFAGFEWRESAASGSTSVTSTLAGLLTFLLGVLSALGEMQVSVAVAIVAAGLMALREVLHAWVKALTAAEIRGGLILLAMAFLLLPLLPEKPVDPWDLLNLREIWVMATMIAGVSFLGYIAVRGLGPRWGVLVTAAAGGLASSTATTASLARMAVSSGTPARLLVAGMLVAGIVMQLRVLVLALVLRAGLLPILLPPMLAGVLTSLAIAVWMARASADHPPGDQATPELGIRSPLDLMGALRMAGVIAVVILVAGLVQRQFGTAGLYIVAAVSGIADVDAITISSARMAGDPQASATAILIAVAVNSCSKALIAAWIGRPVIGMRFLIPTLFGIAVAAGVYVFLP